MERPIFTIRGRIAHANGAPAAQVWVSIVDKDHGDPDDLLGLGMSNAEGEFRLSYTPEAFNQEPQERETAPELYFVLATQGTNGPMPVCRHDAGELGAKDVDVGTLMLPLLPVGDPPVVAGLRHAPEALKPARRLHLDQAIVERAAREVAPIVESLTGWRGLLEGLAIEIVDSMSSAYRQRGALLLGRNDFSEAELDRLLGAARRCDADFVALWEPTLRKIILNRAMLERWPLDVLKVTLGHELVHVGQSRFHPEIDARVRDCQKRQLEALLEGGDAELRPDEWRTMANVEGYAHYIESKYLTGVYTHGNQFAVGVSQAQLDERRRRTEAIDAAAERYKAMSPHEILAQPGSKLDPLTMTKASQYTSGMAVYVMRTTDRAVAFDPTLLPEPTLDQSKLEELLARAVTGCAVSQQAVGWIYFNGEGVERDPKVATVMFRVAAENGMPFAAYMLARLLPENDPEEERWFRVAAVWGLADAQLELGRLLLRPHQPTTSRTEGLGWIEKAALQGNVAAMELLGGVLWVGEGVPADVQTAMQWLTKAAEAGAPRAMRILVSAYTHGEGAKRDAISARFWEKRAAAAEAKAKARSAP